MLIVWNERVYRMSKDLIQKWSQTTADLREGGKSIEQMNEPFSRRIEEIKTKFAETNDLVSYAESLGRLNQEYATFMARHSTTEIILTSTLRTVEDLRRTLGQTDFDLCFGTTLNLSEVAHAILQEQPQDEQICCNFDRMDWIEPEPVEMPEEPTRSGFFANLLKGVAAA